jgi:hypothetical protein
MRRRLIRLLTPEQRCSTCCRSYVSIRSGFSRSHPSFTAIALHPGLTGVDQPADIRPQNRRWALVCLVQRRAARLSTMA